MKILRKNISVYFFHLLLIVGCKSFEKQATLAKCEPCNGKDVLVAEQNIATIKEDQIRKFLCTIKKECDYNVEFSEHSNMVLFSLLDKQTNKTVKVLSNSSGVDVDYILARMTGPLLDYDVKALQLKVEKAEGSEEIKKRIIEALKKADK